MKKVTLDTIKDVFSKRKPGVVGEYKYYSVLVPLVKKDDKLFILYEERAKNLDRQPGEVCFPGGAREIGENSLECAVRETCEELGIEESDINIISKLDTLYANSSFIMECYLGTVNIDTMKPSKDEVGKTFLVPLEYILEEEPKIATMKFNPMDNDFPYELIKFPNGYNWRKIESPVPIYNYQGNLIWGLTGRITYNFAKVLKGEKHEI